MDDEKNVCKECDGTGRVEREKVVGGFTKRGPHQSYFLYWTYCDVCDGDGSDDAT